MTRIAKGLEFIQSTIRSLCLMRVMHAATDKQDDLQARASGCLIAAIH